jgi:hypothetical protein
MTDKTKPPPCPGMDCDGTLSFEGVDMEGDTTPVVKCPLCGRHYDATAIAEVWGVYDD